MKKISAIYVGVIFLILMVSCSRNSNPTTPSLSEIPQLNENEVSASSEIERPINEHQGVFGIWKVHVDMESMTAEIIPSRNAKAIGDIYDADLSQFLTVSPCSNCLRIPHIELNAYGDLNIDISMRHPFNNMIKRPDLHGFDTRAIIIMGTDNMLSFPSIDITMPDGSIEDAEITSTYLGVMNADGYTSHYDELVTDNRYFMGGTEQAGNLNPFFRFFENPSNGAFDPHIPSGHNVMPVGSAIETRTVVFDLDLTDGLSFSFYVVADVAYGHSAVLQNRADPQYYLPWFNRTEPWRVEYWIENNNLTDEIGTTAELVVQVFDWQHGYEVDTEYPNPSNLDGIPQSSDVLQVELSIPDFQDDLLIGTYESGTGRADDPLRYRITITNEEEHYYDAYGLLAIRDTLNGQAYPDGRMGVPVSPAGFPYGTQDIRDYSLYQYVHINNNSNNIFLDYQNHFGNYEFFLTQSSQFAFDDSGVRNAFICGTHHMDPGHTKFTYDWDYNYNGINFDVDGSGMPSPRIQYTNAGRHDVCCRIRTNSVPPKEYRFEFPVYAEGEIYNKKLFTPGNKNYATSIMRGNSVYVNENGFWLAYQKIDSGIPDIWLAVGDKSGNVTHQRVTTTSNGAEYPSLTVIEEGIYQGVYIAYCVQEATNIHVYTNYGSLDGSGFIPANVKRVSSAGDAIEIFPSMVYCRNTLHVYYMDFRIATAYICAAHSDDGASTWIYDGHVINNGSNQQTMPIAITPDISSYVYLVWSDFKDYTTNGSDLWRASSSDGISFPSPKNISTMNGKIDEMYPDFDMHGNQLFIVYLTKSSTSSEPDTSLYLKVHNMNTGANIDYAVDVPNIAGEMHSYPSVSANGENKIYIAYAQQLTSDRTIIFYLKYLDPYSFGNFSGYTLIRTDVVAVTSDNATNINPVVATDLPVAYGIDAFVAWTDPSAGLVENGGFNYGNLATAEYIFHSGVHD